MATADFKINTSVQADRGYDATNSEAITLTLENSPAVDVFSVVYSVVASSDGAPAITLSPSTGIPTTPTGNVTFTTTATGFHSYTIQCQVNGGRSTNNRGATVVNADYTKQRILAIRAATTLIRKTVPAEITQYEADGWSVALNEMAEVLETGSVGGVDPSEPILTNGAAPTITSAVNIQSLASTLGFSRATAAPASFTNVAAAAATASEGLRIEQSITGGGVGTGTESVYLTCRLPNGSAVQTASARITSAWTTVIGGGTSKLVLSTALAGTLNERVTISGTGLLKLHAYSTGLLHSDSSGNCTSSLVVNADVDAAAAIAGTKISPDFGAQNVATSGTLILSTLGGSGTRNLTVDNSGNVGATAASTYVAGDGLTESPAGTFNVGATDSTVTIAANGIKVATGGITNTEVNASAAIAGSKIDPAFGSQNVSTTGTIGGGAITGTSLTAPSLNASGGTLTLAGSTATLTASGTTTTNVGTASTTNNFGMAAATNVVSGDLLRINADIADAGTSSPDILELRRTRSGGNGGTNIGLSVLASLENASGTVKSAGYLKCALTTATAGNETANWSLWAMGAGGAASEKWNWYYDGNFFGDYVFESNVFIADTTAGYRFKDAANRGGLDQDGSNHLRLKSYNTKDIVLYTGADASGVGGVLRATFSNTGAQTHELPVSVVHRLLWGKVFEDKTANYGNTTDSSDTVITTYAAADETIFNVVATFTAWKDNTDYATYVRTASFRRDGGTLTQQGSTAATYSEASAGFSTCLADLNASGTNIRGIARGVAATTINWSCKIVVTGETP